MQGEAIYIQDTLAGSKDRYLYIHHVAIGKARVVGPKSMRVEEYVYTNHRWCEYV